MATRISQEAAERIRSAHQQGVEVDVLALTWGCSTSTVHNVLGRRRRFAGDQPPPQELPCFEPSSRGLLDEALVYQMRLMVGRDGMDVAQVAEAFGISRTRAREAISGQKAYAMMNRILPVKKSVRRVTPEKAEAVRRSHQERPDLSTQLLSDLHGISVSSVRRALSGYYDSRPAGGSDRDDAALLDRVADLVASGSSPEEIVAAVRRYDQHR